MLADVDYLDHLCFSFKRNAMGIHGIHILEVHLFLADVQRRPVQVTNSPGSRVQGPGLVNIT